MNLFVSNRIHNPEFFTATDEELIEHIQGPNPQYWHIDTVVMQRLFEALDRNSVEKLTAFAELAKALALPIGLKEKQLPDITYAYHCRLLQYRTLALDILETFKRFPLSFNHLGVNPWHDTNQSKDSK
jgi:hypothetical protein